MAFNRSMPQAPIIPELSYPDVDAAARWLIDAFGFTLRLRIGNHRAQMAFGAGAVVLRAGAAPGPEADASHSIMVRVENVDEHYLRAATAGAKVSGAPTTHAYGERQYAAQDLAGHWWVFSQSVADVDPGEWGGELVNSQHTA